MRALLAATVLAPALAGCSVTVEKAHPAPPAPVVSEAPASLTPSPPPEPTTPLDYLRKNARGFGSITSYEADQLGDVACDAYRMFDTIQETYDLLLKSMKYDAEKTVAIMGYAAMERCPQFEGAVEAWAGR